MTILRLLRIRCPSVRVVCLCYVWRFRRKRSLLRMMMFIRLFVIVGLRGLGVVVS